MTIDQVLGLVQRRWRPCGRVQSGRGRCAPAAIPSPSQRESSPIDESDFVRVTWVCYKMGLYRTIAWNSLRQRARPATEPFLGPQQKKPYRNKRMISHVVFLYVGTPTYRYNSWHLCWVSLKKKIANDWRAMFWCTLVVGTLLSTSCDINNFDVYGSSHTLYILFGFTPQTQQSSNDNRFFTQDNVVNMRRRMLVEVCLPYCYTQLILKHHV